MSPGLVVDDDVCDDQPVVFRLVLSHGGWVKGDETLPAAEIDLPSKGGNAVFREQQVAQSILAGVVVHICRLVALVETKANEPTVGRQPQVTLAVLGDGEDAVASKVIVAVLCLKAVIGGIVEEEPAAVGDRPQSAGTVLQAVRGVVDSKVTKSRRILSHGHACVTAVRLHHADDALVVGSQPDVALPVLADAPDVAVGDVAVALSECDGEAASVGQHHAQCTALPDPKNMFS